MKYIDLVFTDFPSPTTPAVFIAAENTKQHSVRLGTWKIRKDGARVLRITEENFELAVLEPKDPSGFEDGFAKNH